MHPGQKLQPGARVVFDGTPRRFTARSSSAISTAAGSIRLWTDDGGSVDDAIDAIGHVPLPPYIKRDDRADDRDRYQTVFARGARLGGRADRRPAFHARARRVARRARRRDRRDHAARRLRHVSAGPRRARRGSPARTPSTTRSREPAAPRDQPRARRRPPRHRRRDDDDADARGGGARARRADRRRSRRRPTCSSTRASSSASSAAC